MDLTSAAVPTSASAAAVMKAYRATRDAQRRSVASRYRILGFLNSGTYGRVYKAEERLSKTDEPRPAARLFAVKKFKPDKSGDASTATGISQSAIREIMLNQELQHENIVWLREVLLQDSSIFLVYEYVDHDFLQIIHHHVAVLRAPIGAPMLKSMLWQLLNGIHYLHENWIMHRDLKPANILVNAAGVVKVGDLGLARIYADPIVSLYATDMVVVTIWYRAPELLLGARHYSTAIDMWATGCIWGELMALRPIFKGEEVRLRQDTKSAPLQTPQLAKITDVLGTPTRDRWPAIESLPEYAAWLAARTNHKYVRIAAGAAGAVPDRSMPKTLYPWYTDRSSDLAGYDLFDHLLQYDPGRRISAGEALEHPWFAKAPLPTESSIFASVPASQSPYPAAKVLANEPHPAMHRTRG
ncbi:[pyruvate dehydrogenase (acetyl-transferring)] kinase [Malassezia sp. CBS 17886]|nr:[pyruvate dehydrogenase (acetyl-transferring)] kinase [Malassezia sp. CBS 17886]